MLDLPSHFEAAMNPQITEAFRASVAHSQLQ
jgi:hypothetical protein